jgi:hypothetical protein
MDARSNFMAGIASLTRADLGKSARFIGGARDAPAAPRAPPERPRAGDVTHSVAIAKARNSYYWRHKFPLNAAPSAEVARKARERSGWLLDGSPQT